MIKKEREYYIGLILEYLSDKLPEEGKEELRQWIAASEDNNRCFMDIRKTWKVSLLANDNSTFDPERAFNYFKERQSYVYTPAGKKKNNLFLWKWNWLRVAAVFLPFLLLSYGVYSYFSGSGPQYNAALTQITVPYGSKTNIQLGDGSIVWLNAGTTIEYDTDFGKSDRRVRLVGEAYFDIAHQPQKPFIVETGELNIEVLGTRFNVNAYSENSRIKVSLMEGSVKMETNEQILVLSPDEEGVFDISQKTTTKTLNPSLKSSAWINDFLIFKDQSFAEIVKILERRFNVKINIRNETIRKRYFTGEFVNNESIHKIFDIMSSDEDFRFTIQGNEIEVY